MRRLAVLLATCAAFLAFAGPAQSAPDIYVLDHSTSITPEQVANYLPAFQKSIDQDFGPAWNATANLKFTGSAPKGAWTITISDAPDISGVAGYHYVTRSGTPRAKVFVNPGMWDLTFSHELDEMLADPYTDRASFTWPGHVFYMIEVCDPVEEDYYTYPSADGVNLVKISDFVTDNWYTGLPGKRDFKGLVKKAHYIRPGGYAVVSADGANWVQLTWYGKREKVRG